LRGKALKSLEELFDMAKDFAQNKNLKLKQRQMWVRVAAYISQVMSSIADGFDERQIDIQLDELERLIHEAKAKTKDGKTEGKAEASNRN
jgi:hypothetical protein